MKSGVFAYVLIHLNVQRSKSYYLKGNYKNVAKINWIKFIETLVND